MRKIKKVETFYEFVVKQFLDEPSPCGDLAKDMKSDSDFPKESRSKQEIQKHLKSYGNILTQSDVMDAFRECWSEYKKSPKERRKVIKLKPCPFCGRTPDMGHDERGNYKVWCFWCGANIGDHGYDMYEATEHWNRRDGN